MVEYSSAFIGFVALHWTHSSKSISSLYWGHQNWQDPLEPAEHGWRLHNLSGTPVTVIDHPQ